jgi:hydrogenase maturation protease
MGRIIKEEPETILLADAVHLDLNPGQYRILQHTDILKCGLTTHDMSSRMLIEFLQNQTPANIVMLGVQPKHVSLGEPLSECVTETLTEVARLIQEARSCTKPI